MNALQRFSDVVGDLYDAALDTSLFPDVLEKLRVYLDAAFVVVFSENVAVNEGAFVFSAGADHSFLQRYSTEFMHLNPVRAPALPTAKAGDIFNTLTYLTDKEYRQSRYYLEFFSEQGYLDTMVTILERNSMNFALFSAIRSEEQGYATQEDMDRLALIAPHIRRAVSIAELIDVKSVENSKFMALIDNLRAAVVFTGKNGEIIGINKSARGMLDEATVIIRRNNRLSAIDKVAANKLAAALASREASDQMISSNGDSILLDGDGTRYVAHILPLKLGRRWASGENVGASAAVFIREIGTDQPSAATSISRLYDLTPRELTVLFSILADNSVKETAAILGLSDATVKTHLKNLFRKTGVRKQSQLATLVAGVTNPFIVGNG